MAELTITPEEIRVALDKFVENFNPDAANRDEVGTVATSGDGIARVEGLPSAMANELLKFENGTLGIALNLDVCARSASSSSATPRASTRVRSSAAPARSSPCRSATATSAASWTPWATRSTAWANSPTCPSGANSNSRRPA